MSFASWIESLKRGPGRDRRTHHRRQHTRTVSPRRSFLPRLEMLEDRNLLSTFMVLNLGDAGSGSLRQAILDANKHSGADVIRFAPQVRGTIALASELSVVDDVRIDGPGACRLTLSGGGSTRVFDISGRSSHVMIDDLTIANGMAIGHTAPGTGVSTAMTDGGPVTLGGGILNMGASLTLDDVTLVNNRANASGPGGDNAAGGGIANVFGATLKVMDSSFQGNQAVAGAGDSYGGGIYNDAGSTLTVKDCTFAANQATQGVYIGSFGGAIANACSQATVSDSIFRNNVTHARDGANGGPNQPGGDGRNGAGGGIASSSWGLLEATYASTGLAVSGSTFIGNQAIGGKGGDGGSGASGGSGSEGDAGAIAPMGSGSSCIVSFCVFVSNRGFGGAGGNGGDGGNGGPGQLGDGGAIDVMSAALTVTDSLFMDNQGVGGAGGMGGDGGNGGDAGGSFGGGIMNTLLGDGLDVLPTLVVSNSTFINNRAIGGPGGNGGIGGAGGMGAGGGIETPWGTLDVCHSTFLGNQAIGGNGGAGANGMGGFSGMAAGGGIVCGQPEDTNSNGSITDCTLVGNVARGGAGTAGSDGGMALGGGIVNGLGTLVVSRTTLIGNEAIGGAAGAGANGGYALGGGFYNMGAATLNKSTITRNKAKGGAAGSGGEAGLGIGGGVYNDRVDGATISIDALTWIFANYADLFPDRYGC